MTDALDNVTIYKWNENGQVEQEISPLGRISATIYDEHGRISQTIAPTGAKTEYAFDDRGDRVKVVSPLGAVTQYQYDAQHQIVCVIDPAGHQWQRAFDRAGKIVRVTNPLGSSLRYSYDSQGDLVEINEGSRSWRFEWASDGALASSTDASGHKTKYVHDAEGSLITTIDAAGHKTQLQRDGLGRVCAIRHPDGSCRKAARNAYGQVTELVNELGAATRRRYALCGLLVEEVHPHGGRIHYDWSNLPGQLLAVHNELGEAYRFEYDADARQIKETDFCSQVTQFEYGHGTLATAIRNAANERLEFTRDFDGRLTSATLAGVQLVKYAYDARGFLSSADNGDCRVERVYDALGRITDERQGQHQIKNEYDANGMRVRRVSSLGRTTEFQWNENGKLSCLLQDGQEPLCFEYDAIGNERRRFIKEGIEIRNAYDSRGRKSEQRVDTHSTSWLDQIGGRSEPLLQRQYRYDAASQLLDIQDGSLGVTKYSYDIADRIVEAILPDGCFERFTYDAANNLLAHAQNLVEERLTYRAGNRLSQQGEVVCEHNVLGQLTKKMAPGQTTLYQWDALGNLTAVVLPDGTNLKYRYDALGRRVEKSSPAERVEFVWDGDVVLHEVHKSENKTPVTMHWEFEPGGFAPVAKEQCGIRYFCINDNIGTPRELISEEGKVVWRARFTVYGKQIGDPASVVDCPVRFQGQWHDAETNLHYNRYRYYDPVTGRYLSQDPKGLEAGLNSFTYAVNTTGWIDPYGLNGDEPCSLKKLDDSYLKKNKIDAHALKEAEVGGKISHWNISQDSSTEQLWLTPVKKGASNPIPLGLTLEEASTMYPLKK